MPPVQSIPPRSFLFVRHGQTDWNRDGRFLGRTDLALNETGLAQARQAATRLAPVEFDLIVTSPLVRAMETASIIGTALKRPLRMETLLVECDFGVLEGASIARTMWRNGLTRKDQLAGLLGEGGENWGDLLRRSRLALQRWLSRAPAGTIVFVGHDAILQAICAQLCRTWFDSAHGVPYRFAPAEDRWRMEVIG